MTAFSAGELTALIGGLTALVIAVGALLVQIGRLHTLVNSRMTELLDLTRQAAFSAGQADTATDTGKSPREVGDSPHIRKL